MTVGFPIRRSPDQCAFDRSPGLIAAYHVLHRLSTPRHPPCTLSNLTTLMRSWPPFASPKTARHKKSRRLSVKPHEFKINNRSSNDPTEANFYRGIISNVLDSDPSYHRSEAIQPTNKPLPDGPHPLIRLSKSTIQKPRKAPNDSSMMIHA